MAVPTAVTYWVPDRQPVWLDIVVIGLVSLSFTLSLTEVDHSWGWFAVGLILCFLGIGPVAQSTVGEKVGTWFRAIGQLGRAIVIVLFAAGLWATMIFVPVVRIPIYSFGFGMMVTLGVVVGIQIVAFGPPDRWTRE